jgi:hypothetical protein
MMMGGVDAIVFLDLYADAAFAASLAPRQVFSTSWNEGRKCPGIARRPNSTAMIGALPFKNEIISTRNTWRYARSSSAALDMLAANGPTNP